MASRSEAASAAPSSTGQAGRWLQTRRPSSANALLHRRARLAIHFATPHGLTFIVRLFAASEREPHFDLAVLEVEARRYQREALLNRSPDQLTNLRLVQEKAPLASGIVIDVAAMTVRID